MKNNYAVIEEGFVSNIVVSDKALHENWVEIDESLRIGIGWEFSDGHFREYFPEATKYAPEEVSMAQCRLALFDKHGIETDDDFYGLVDNLPEEMRVRARLELRTRPTVRYDNPLVIAFCEAKGWDRDELFVYADTL